MEKVIVGRARTSSSTARATLRTSTGSHVVRFEGVAPDRTGPEAFVVVARAAAMDDGRPVLSAVPVGRAWRERFEALAAPNLANYPHLRRSRLIAPPRLRRRPGASGSRHQPMGHDGSGPGDGAGDGRRVAAFFSGGIDSVHLVLEHHDEIDDLLFVRGFDVPVEDAERCREVLVGVRRLATELGKPLMVVTTDVRRFTDSLASWAWCSYAAMVATTILLGGSHRKVLAAASVADRHLPAEVVELRRSPTGNGSVEMVLAGTEETRVAKIQAILDSGVSTDGLRVCWQDVRGTLNCGRCDKCVRTMAALAALGALEGCAAFPDVVDLKAVAGLSVSNRAGRAFVSEVLDAAREHDRPELATALATASSVLGERAGP